MKKTPTLLASALLACCMPLAAAASEATLSPATNNGSGQMPSGFGQLNFYIANGDWAGELRLPTASSHGDRVAALSDAMWSARFDLAGTAFAAAGAVPFLDGALLEFSWNAGAGQWDLQPGATARTLIAPNVAKDRIANTYHMLTQYTMLDGMHAGQVLLPYWAPDNALLTVANRASWKSQINTNPSSTTGHAWHTCSSGQSCTFTYVGSKRAWVEVVEGGPAPVAAQLPFPVASVTRVSVDPAHDVVATRMTLPAKAVHGDVYVLVDNHGFDAHSVDMANTSLIEPLRLRTGKEVRLRFDEMTGRENGTWHLVN